MNKRLIIQDMAGLLAEKTGKSKSECERFLRTFVFVVSEGLMADKLVKIKGIGTLKLSLMEQRESVDVNTGERFILPAHYKCTFQPDTELKERVNEPFSFFETVELAEDVDLKHMGSAPEEAEPATDTPSSVPTVPVAPPTDDEKHKNNHKWGWLGSIGIFLVILCGVFLYLYVGSHYVVDNPSVQPEAPLSPVVADEPALLIQDKDDSFALHPLSKDTVDKKDSVSTEKETDTSFKELKIVRIKENDRLTYLAEEYYGNRVFWVYIYQFNKTVIRNPDVITAGMELILPDPALYGINANDSTSIQKAINLGNEIKETKK